jgi:hypothetical protein
MSYDYAARTTKSDIPFGEGAVAGVIASEAANNAEEGGSMIPTLFFGIPGSSSMAIMMGALTFVGIAVGPNLLSRDLGLSFSLAGSVLVANLIAVPLFFLVIPAIVRLSALRREAMAPFAIVISVAAAIIDTPRPLTVVLLAVGSILGIALKLANWPRAPLILGYVVGGMAETSYFQTSEIFGWSALARPLTAGLALLIVGWVVYVVRSRPVGHMPGPRFANVGVAAGLAIGFAATVATALATIEGPGQTAPIAVALFGGALCLLILYLALAGPDRPLEEPIRHLTAFALYLAAIPVFGMVAAGAGFIFALLVAAKVKAWRAALAAAIYFALQLGVLATIFDVMVEKEIVGRIVWSFMDF